jgi:pyridoxal phosphate enzyme (YggS family)
MSAIHTNLQDVRTRIAITEKMANRLEGSVSLVAVSKFHPVEAVQEAINAGQKVFGENRVQEAASKFPALKASHNEIELHLIGPLQTNKVGEAIQLFDVIETVDRPKLAESLASEMDRAGHRPDLLIQVNTGEEPQKAGVLPVEIDTFMELCREKLSLPVIGLMCIPPIDDEPAMHFGLLAEMARRHGLKVLSMGMSADFETAIRLGATHVRVGSAVFGPRLVATPG